MIALELRYTPQDALRDPYPLIPFTLPAGTRGLTVRQKVSPDSATVDLGFADSAGVRGWSGGARRTFTVTASDATPGYLPSGLRPGQHYVLLGLYHIPPEGAEVALEIEFHPEGPLHWVRGDLHAHTWHSDAAGSPAQLAAAARDRGLQFVCVADHNTVSHQQNLHDPILLPAQEVTTYRGHFVAHGKAPLLEFRITHPDGVRQALAQAKQFRLLTVVAHPVPTCPSCDWAWGLEDQFDALEVWNGPWLALNWIAREKWLKLLEQGVRMPIVGGSDRHQSAQWPDLEPPHLQVGSPTTWIKAASSHPGDLYAGILAGRTCVSAEPAGPLIELSLEGEHLRYEVTGPTGGSFTLYWGHEAIHTEPFNKPLRGQIQAEPYTYYRAEVTFPTPAEHLRMVQQHWPEYASGQEAVVTMRAMSGAIWT